MRFYLFLFLMLPLEAFSQAPTVSNITFDGVGHSVVRASFAASAQFYWLRTRYVAAPGSCTDGASGSVQGSAYNNFNFGALHAGSGNTVVVGGLSPNTTYQICPEVSADFSHWSSGSGATVTTLPLPAEHPARPISPTAFNTNYPVTAGYDNVTVASDCSNLMSLLNAAIDNQMNKGTVINVPAGAVCSGPFNITRRPGDLTYFGSNAVDTSADSLSVTNHGLTEGQGLIFGTSYGCLPGSLTNSSGDCHKNGPIIPGQLYFAHIIDANRFQLYSGAASGNGGVLCRLPDGGTGTEYFVRWPRPLKWIVIRTSTPDAQFTPEHVRISPAWVSKMAVLRSPAYAMAGSTAANTLVSVGNYDGNDMSMVANLRFVGLEFTYEGNGDAFTSSDPLPWYTLFATYQSDQNIIVDRCYFHGLGTPHRVYNALRWDGLNVAIVDSYLNNFEYFHSVYSGLSLTKVN